MTDESDSSKKPSSKEPGSADNENAAGDTYNLPGDFRGAQIYIKSTIDSTKNNVRLQNLRDFTVQIRDANDQIVGTGIAVSTDGKIVTCAHVVEAAGIDPRNSKGAEINVYFPQARGGEEKTHRANVAKYFTDFDDDVVLLELTGSLSPLAPEQIAVLGSTGNLRDRDFDSFGYRSLGGQSIGKFIVGAPAHGKILGPVELSEGSKFHREPLVLESNQLNAGMSGAGVLDVEDNLVVGIVSHVYDPAVTGRDRDTALGVDVRVLPLPPFELVLRTEPLKLKAAPEPRTDEQTKQQVLQVAQDTIEQRAVEEKYCWNNAPAVLKEWTGRDDLLKQITADWNDSGKHVTGLIGFGGEGKSSLARKWIDDVIARSGADSATTKQSPTREEIASQRTLAITLPDGVFWWGFYENRSVDEFFESALKYFGVDSRRYQSSSQRAQIVGVLLNTGRYLFVLDGLEVMQHQEGDQYGLLQSNDLRDLLTLFARSDNQSFCLITSRSPLLDLMEYTTYTHRDVERLSEEDGRALLRRLGVTGSDDELNKVVADWDGHALTLSILAAYLAERYNGEIKHLADIPVPTADEPRYERVHRVLRRYDEHLTKDEREFLKLFSVFRLPVHESAFEKVFEPLLKSLDKYALLKLVSRLANYRLIRHDEHEKSYTTHPIIRNHYFALFTKGDPSQEKAAHQQIKDYYLSIVGDRPEYPTLDDLKPLIEAVHHACQAEAYDEARDVFWQRLYQEKRRVLVFQLGAYETELNLISEFFPSNDLAQEPGGNNQEFKRFLISEIGSCLMNLGRLHESVLFYERAGLNVIEVQDWHNASIAYSNLASIYASIGVLDESARAAVRAFELGNRASDEYGEEQPVDKYDQAQSLSHQGWAAHLHGDLETAQDIFEQAEKAETERQNDKRYLYSNRGIFHADCLRRIGQPDYARRVTEANLQICEQYHWLDDISKSDRVLGDLDSDSGNHVSARAHYESALKNARSISVRFVLIEALLGRGKWQAKHMKDANAAFSDLNEALGYCVESGYRIYEADVRVALAWANLADLTPGPSPTGRGESLTKAKAEAERALQMSNEMGYHWGKVDAEEVLKAISD